MAIFDVGGGLHNHTTTPKVKRLSKFPSDTKACSKMVVDEYLLVPFIHASSLGRLDIVFFVYKWVRHGKKTWSLKSKLSWYGFFIVKMSTDK